MATGKADLLARPEPPGTDHKEAAGADENQPDHCDPPRLYRIAAAEMHCCGQKAGRCWNGHPNKVLTAGSARIARLRVVADIESRQSRSSPAKKKKADESARVYQILMELRVDGVGQKTKSPDVCQQAGSHTERDDIGQRIQFLSKLAGGVGHACDAAVEGVK